MSKRYTRKISRLLTKKEVEKVMEGYAQLEVEKEVLQQNYEEELNKLKARFEPQIAALNEHMEDQADQLQYYAETHYQQFKKHRSMSTAFGNLGFRLCPPKVKILEGYDLKEIVENVDQNKPELIVVKKSLNKEQILKHREEPEFIEMLHRLGLDVVQDESFFIEPKAPSQDKDNDAA